MPSDKDVEKLEIETKKAIAETMQRIFRQYLGAPPPSETETATEARMREGALTAEKIAEAHRETLRLTKPYRDQAAALLSRSYMGGIKIYSVDDALMPPTPKSKRIPAHPLICWLSKLLACFGVQLDPWVEVPVRDPMRTAFMYGNALFVSRRDMRGLVNIDTN